MRILLGWAWTYLIVAELIGTSTGITWFITQQARYKNYANVYAAIVIIGLIGLGTDLLLAWLGRRLFPWQPKPQQPRASWRRAPTRAAAARVREAAGRTAPA
jgi:NitT/TauT family transport system permease protein